MGTDYNPTVKIDGDKIVFEGFVELGKVVTFNFFSSVLTILVGSCLEGTEKEVVTLDENDCITDAKFVAKVKERYFKNTNEIRMKQAYSVAGEVMYFPAQ